MKSICTNYWEIITTSLPNTTVLEHLEVRFTHAPSSKLINAIEQNKSIKTLKFYFWMDNEDDKSSWAMKLTKCIQHSTSLEQLTISGETDLEYPSQFFHLLTDSLLINTSIKSMVYGLTVLNNHGHSSVDLSAVYKFIGKLKENNSLEELTLNKVHMDMDNELFSSIEDCVQHINETRNKKGKANLKVNITCVKRRK